VNDVRAWNPRFCHPYLPPEQEGRHTIEWQALGDYKWPADGRYRLICGVCGWVKRDVERRGRQVISVPRD
jgi:hypothetical protein